MSRPFLPGGHGEPHFTELEELEMELDGCRNEYALLESEHKAREVGSTYYEGEWALYFLGLGWRHPDDEEAATSIVKPLAEFVRTVERWAREAETEDRRLSPADLLFRLEETDAWKAVLMAEDLSLIPDAEANH